MTHTLELPKLKETDTGALSDWMRFLSFDDEAELDALATKDAGIGKAVKMLKYMSKDETLQFLEMSHQKYEWDVVSMRSEAFREGEVCGRVGGKERGEVYGRYEGTLQVARASPAKGLPIDLVDRITGLDAEAIRRLQEN
ncbi:MAG: Rpn family recombination-promoting nuclease/putative transposase [Coriobacteriales bacterium]|jgi:predicted transposase/invertase (TIGR01784 family)|nr:Rpn family recombination-promoting nuclease/putative transposase [Coriobacteriales bacterium]